MVQSYQMPCFTFDSAWEKSCTRQACWQIKIFASVSAYAHRQILTSSGWKLTLDWYNFHQLQPNDKTGSWAVCVCDFVWDCFLACRDGALSRGDGGRHVNIDTWLTRRTVVRVSIGLGLVDCGGLCWESAILGFDLPSWTARLVWSLCTFGLFCRINGNTPEGLLTPRRDDIDLDTTRGGRWAGAASPRVAGLVLSWQVLLTKRRTKSDALASDLVEALRGCSWLGVCFASKLSFGLSLSAEHKIFTH